jgi:hypothetical protein
MPFWSEIDGGLVFDPSGWMIVRLPCSVTLPVPLTSILKISRPTRYRELAEV